MDSTKTLSNLELNYTVFKVKDTKHTIVYENKNSPIGKLYLQRHMLTLPPEELHLTVRTGIINRHKIKPHIIPMDQHRQTDKMVYYYHQPPLDLHLLKDIYLDKITFQTFPYITVEINLCES